MATDSKETERKSSRTKTPVQNLDDIDVEPGYKKEGKKQWPRLTEEEQDLAYELKAQLMRNIEQQNQYIKTELKLTGKMEDLKIKKEKQEKMRHESDLTRLNAIKCMNLFEKNYRKEKSKVDTLEYEVKKANKVSEEYKELYEAEVLNHGGQPMVPLSARGDGDTIKMMRSTTSPIRTSDIVRKNECLLIENNELRREIKRLKHDNIDLIKKIKGAEVHAFNVTNHLATSEAHRVDLLKRFTKERGNHQVLSHKMTRQVSYWLQSKKRLQEIEDEVKWHGGTTSLDVHGAEKRFYKHQVTKNVLNPKKMLPVEEWAQANQSSTV